MGFQKEGLLGSCVTISAPIKVGFNWVRKAIPSLAVGMGFWLSFIE